MKKWCPRCQKEIEAPGTSSLYNFAKFWRDNKCIYCDSSLFIIDEQKSSQTTQTNKNNHSIDKLRFEHEKRRSEIQSLQTELSRLQIDYNEVQDDWEGAFNDAKSKKNLDVFDASGYQSASKYLIDQMDELRYRIKKLQDEMTKIERELDSKW